MGPRAWCWHGGQAGAGPAGEMPVDVGSGKRIVKTHRGRFRKPRGRPSLLPTMVDLWRGRSRSSSVSPRRALPDVLPADRRSGRRARARSAEQLSPVAAQPLHRRRSAASRERANARVLEGFSEPTGRLETADRRFTKSTQFVFRRSHTSSDANLSSSRSCDVQGDGGPAVVRSHWGRRSYRLRAREER